MPSQNNNSVSTSQILVPVLLVAVTLFLSLSFQLVQVMRDRDALQVFVAQQEKPLEDARRLQVQLTALALGTKKLADSGDKNAAAIITRMQQAGITVGGPPPGADAPSGLPTGAPPAPAMSPAPAPAPAQ